MVMDTLGVLWVYVQAWLSGMHLVQGTMSGPSHLARLGWAAAGDLGGRQMSALSTNSAGKSDSRVPKLLGGPNARCPPGSRSLDTWGTSCRPDWSPAETLHILPLMWGSPITQVRSVWSHRRRGLEAPTWAPWSHLHPWPHLFADFASCLLPGAGSQLPEAWSLRGFLENQSTWLVSDLMCTHSGARGSHHAVCAHKSQAGSGHKSGCAWIQRAGHNSGQGHVCVCVVGGRPQ